MRSKKALINSSVNILSYVLIFIPNLLIRQAFISALGNEMLGLNSLYTNIISWLSIAEMGIGTAIVYSLYKPFKENDRKKISSYINFYGKFYRVIGLIILFSGITIIPFLKFFINDNIDMKLATYGYILFLINTFITYIFSHKICILNVAQESYKSTIGTLISKLAIFSLQYIMFKTSPNFLYFITIQIVVNLIYYILINIYIYIRYPWLSKKSGNLEKSELISLIKNVKAIFMHKIGSLIVFSTDNLVISKFIGLTALAKYTNYQLILSSVQTIISTGLSGITASIGNLLVDGDKEKAYDIHKKIFFLNFWITSFIIISLYNTLEQFIYIWIGKGQFLDKLTFYVILINMYFTLMRGSVEKFQDASGNFSQDRFMPLIEGIINLIMSIVLLKKLGLAGVFLGTLVSNFTVVFWTKPYVVYKYVFNKSLLKYFILYFRYAIVAIITLITTSYITQNIRNQYDLRSFIINCIINIIIINAIYIMIFFRSEELKYYLKMIKNLKGNVK